MEITLGIVFIVIAGLLFVELRTTTRTSGQ
jgi:hypothetical protein